MAYVPNRKMVQDRKVEKLQQQLHNMKQQMEEQALIRRKLETLTDLETARTQKAIDKVKQDFTGLQEDIYRKEHRDELDALQAENNKMLEDVMMKRTKEFQRSQAKKAANIQRLALERQKILEARNQLKEKNNTFRSLPSPVGSDISEIIMRTPPAHTPTYRSVHSTDSTVKRVVKDMPDAIDRIWNLREEMTHDYIKMKKPYNGELGINTYQAWQLPDYFMVRGLVQEFFDDFIIKHIPPDRAVFEREMKLQMLEQNDREWNQTSQVLAERKAVKLVAEEVLLEVTSEVTKQIAMEESQQVSMFRMMASNIFLKEAEVQVTGNPEGRDPSDPAYDVITRSFHSLQKNRDHHNERKGVWTHSQMMNHPVAPPPQAIHRDVLPEPPPDRRPSKKSIPEPTPPTSAVFSEEPLEADVHLITHDHLHPEDLRDMQSHHSDDKKEKNSKLWTTIYRKKEISYWAGLRPFVFRIAVPKHCQGVSAMRPSPDHMLLAIGGVSGDVVVYNTQVEPWALVKLDMAPSGEGSVTNIAWSLDSSRLMAIKKSGMISVWDVKGEPASKQVLKAMDSATDDGRPQPYALRPLHTLDARAGHFVLDAGALAEQESSEGLQMPTVASFFPTLTYLAAQDHICAAFGNGDILKLDLGPPIQAGHPPGQAVTLIKPKLKNDDREENLTTEGLEAELLKEHKHSIMLMGCVGQTGQLFSVDRHGFINLWKYDRAHLTGFDWFFPEKKYKLDSSKMMYSPSSSDRAKVIFTDKQRSKSTSQAQIAAERRQAQKTLDGLRLGDPWHLGTDKPGLETSIYIPPGGAMDSGAMFNVVVRHKRTQQLSTYMTRMYRPVKVQSDRILTASLSPSGNEIVFVLLFPEFPPKSPHLMVLVLHLPTMKLRKIRRDIVLTKEEYRDLTQTKIFSSDVSQVYGPTGAEYLFLTLNGRFSCLSLTTGSLVMRLDNITKPKVPGFKGLFIDEKQFPISKYHKVTALGNIGSLYAVVHDQATVSMTVLRLENLNSTEEGRLMWKAYQKWDGYMPRLSEMRINPVEPVLSDMKHKEAEMRSLIMSLPYHKEQVTEEEGKRGKISNYLPLQNKAKDAMSLWDV